MNTARMLVAACAGLGLASPASGQSVPSYGLDFVTIGAPGNRAPIPSEVPTRPEFSYGSVGHVYRLSRTEITVTQWLEFVEAYAPYAADPTDPALLGRNISRGAGGTYQSHPGTERFPAEMNWRYAARYANWLHNGKSLDPEAFESGAYDTSTFGMDPSGHITDQRAHSPGAKFWIPTLDEWIKGGYYDPNRYGPGSEGYWSMPASKNELLISGYPEEGGETSADILNLPFPVGLDVGSYPHVPSPWGLLDYSGGENEWTETSAVLIGIDTGLRYLRGPGFGGSRAFDLLDGPMAFQSPTSASTGLRIASIPSPGGASAAVLGVLTIHRRRRH